MTCKAHGGPIEIFGITIAQVDEQTRLQAVDTWMDPLDMFRQIAPHGIVNTEPMNHKVDLADALDTTTDNNGIKIADEHERTNGVHSHDAAPESLIGKHISSSTGQSADAFVPGQGVCPVVGAVYNNGTNGHAPHPVPAPDQRGNAIDGNTESGHTESTEAMIIDNSAVEPKSLSTMAEELKTETQAARRDEATLQGAEMDIDSRPTVSAYVAEDSVESHTSKRQAEDVPRSIYSSSVTGDVEEPIKVAKRNDFVDESTVTGTRDAIDEHLESTAEVVHPHAKDVERAVQPKAGEAVVAAADSAETQSAKQEMSEIKPEECPAVMNRE